MDQVKMALFLLFLMEKGTGDWIVLCMRIRKTFVGWMILAT
jgi:hypothetical protein